MDTEYDQDFYGWITHTVALLRQGALTEVDVEHVAEELESLGKRDLRQLRSRLQVLVMHLLKWQYQPERQSFSWHSTIDHQRDEIEALLLDSPSLRGQILAALGQIYPKARRDAQRETGLAETIFPESCSYGLDDILDPGFLPAGPSTGQVPGLVENGGYITPAGVDP